MEATERVSTVWPSSPISAFARAVSSLLGRGDKFGITGRQDTHQLAALFQHTRHFRRQARQLAPPAATSPW